MNFHPRLVLLLGILPCLTACHVNLNEYVPSLIARSRLVPESEWNAMGIWRRVGENPATYIPKDFSLKGPRDSTAGTWFHDKRDGKRLFVPRAGSRELSLGVLTGEARKITNPSPTNGVYTAWD